VYQVRGVGKFMDLEIRPRWGWGLLERMLRSVLRVLPGEGGIEGIPEAVANRFKEAVEDYAKSRIGYRYDMNYEGRGRLLPHLYDPTRPLNLPALGERIGRPRELLWLYALLRRLGYDVPEYEEPPPGAFRLKFMEEPREVVWKLAYLLDAGMFGAGDRGFLINTPYIYEEYVGSLFGGRRPGRSEWGIRPDFIVGDGIPLDAKYKTSVARADIYQAFTYATLLGSRRAMLVYPRIRSESVRLGDVRVDILSLLPVE